MIRFSKHKHQILTLIGYRNDENIGISYKNEIQSSILKQFKNKTLNLNRLKLLGDHKNKKLLHTVPYLGTPIPELFTLYIQLNFKHILQ